MAVDLGPTGVFGERQVVEDTPISQISVAYMATGQLDSFATLTGGFGMRDSKIYASTGTDPLARSSVITRRMLIYKPGQGAKFRGTARWVTSTKNAFAFAGLLNLENRIGFASINDVFGILYQRHGSTSIYDLQVTTPAAGPENATVTINGTAYTVPLTAATAEINAIEISDSLNAQQDFWWMRATGDTVTMRWLTAAETTGAFTFSSATAQATFTEVNEGAPFITTLYPQSEWNVKPNRTVHPDKLTPFQVRYQYLGAGIIDFAVENSETGMFDVVHRIKYPGTGENTSISLPTLRAGLIVANLGNETDVQLETASIGTFIEGKNISTREGRAATNTATDIGLLPTSILSLRNRLIFDGKAAESEIKPTLISAQSDSDKPVEVVMYKNPTTATPLIYNYLDKDNSLAEISTTQVTVTGGEIVFAGTVGSFDLTTVVRFLLPGEEYVIAMNITQAPVSQMTATINWKEEFS